MPVDPHTPLPPRGESRRLAVLTYKGSAGVRLVSRNGRELTRRFLEVAAARADRVPPEPISKDPAPAGYR
jgi:hypothetical protein